MEMYRCNKCDTNFLSNETHKCSAPINQKPTIRQEAAKDFISDYTRKYGFLFEREGDISKVVSIAYQIADEWMKQGGIDNGK